MEHTFGDDQPVIIGTIVHYINFQDVECAAIVTRVQGPKFVNLLVFEDGGNSYWVSAVPYHDPAQMRFTNTWHHA